MSTKSTETDTTSDDTLNFRFTIKGPNIFTAHQRIIEGLQDLEGVTITFFSLDYNPTNKKE